MLKKLLSVFIIYTLSTSTYGSDVAFNKRLNYLKSFLIQLTNDTSKVEGDYLNFIDNEIEMINNLQPPYDKDFTVEELVKISDYLEEVRKKIIKDVDSRGLLSKIWDWFVDASPYIVVGIVVITSFIWGYHYFTEEEPTIDSDTDSQNGSNKQKGEEELKPDKEITKESKENEKLKPSESINPPSQEKNKPVKLPPTLKLEKKPITYSEHFKAVQSVSWAPDGRYLASGSHDNYIYIWDTQSPHNKYIVMLHAHNALIHSVAWSPDGTHLASGSSDGTVKIWDMNCLVYKNNISQSIPTASIREKYACTLDKPKIILKGHKDGVSVLAWGPNGHFIASGSHDNMIKVWDIKKLNKKPILNLVEHKDSIHKISWDQKGKHILSLSRDNIMKVWDFKSNKTKPILTFKITDEKIYSFSWSPRANYFAYGLSNGTIKVWDFWLAKHRPVKILKGHTKTVYSIAWSHDGKYIASGSLDKSLNVWDFQSLNKDPVIVQKKLSGLVKSIAWKTKNNLPNKYMIATGTEDSKVNVWSFIYKKNYSN